MRDYKVICTLVILFVFLFQTDVFASEKMIKAGDPFPKIVLPIPKDPSYLKYLGLSGKGTFQINDIKAKVVIIQIFNSG